MNLEQKVIVQAPDVTARLLVFARESQAQGYAHMSVTTVKTGDTGSNITAENYVGISNGAYADGATATIQTVGAVDDAQSGLTAGQKYYVQGDGTLGLTESAGTGTLAGKALSASKLLILSN
jgi:hypothetical protein